MQAVPPPMRLGYGYSDGAPAVGLTCSHQAHSEMPVYVDGGVAVDSEAADLRASAGGYPVLTVQSRPAPPYTSSIILMLGI
jgi:hypothetical protein